MKITTKLAALAAATLLAAGLASCTSTPTASSSAPDEKQDDTISAPSFAPEPEPAPEPVGNLAFGEAMTWVDGLSVSVSQPVAFTPSEYAAGGNHPHNVRFSVTITNGTPENYDGYVFMTATSGGAAAEQIFDTTSGLSGPPSGVILPGQTITFETGFNVVDPASIVLSVAPGFAYEDAIFTNAG